ncbi:MAG: hypothetical protein EXR72_26505 [Myxococcales bacterium]|nr:hypothetical protein [Myxococcales bacterium]
MRATIMAVMIAGTAACGAPGDPGPQKVEIAVGDAPEALTNMASDKLFTLTLSKASKTYALIDLSIDASLPGQTAYALEFKLNDTNGDGLLGQGESLGCTEPPKDLFNATTVGKAVSVNIAEQRAGTFYRVGSATWTPAN